MNKYRVEFTERKTIEVEADDPTEAERVAQNTDNWWSQVDSYKVALISTNNRELILEMFESDQDAMEALERGLNGTTADDLHPDKNIIKSSN